MFSYLNHLALTFVYTVSTLEVYTEDKDRYVLEKYSIYLTISAVQYCLIRLVSDCKQFVQKY